MKNPRVFRPQLHRYGLGIIGVFGLLLSAIIVAILFGGLLITFLRFLPFRKSIAASKTDAMHLKALKYSSLSFVFFLIYCLTFNAITRSHALKASNSGSTFSNVSFR